MPRRAIHHNTGRKDAKNRTIYMRESGTEFVKTNRGHHAKPATGVRPARARGEYVLTGDHNALGRAIYVSPKKGRRVVRLTSKKTGAQYWGRPALHPAGYRPARAAVSYTLSDRHNALGRPIYTSSKGRNAVRMTSRKTGHEYWGRPAIGGHRLTAGPTNRYNLHGLQIHRSTRGHEYVMRPHRKIAGHTYRARPKYSLFD